MSKWKNYFRNYLKRYMTFDDGRDPYGRRKRGYWDRPDMPRETSPPPTPKPYKTPVVPDSGYEADRQKTIDKMHAEIDSLKKQIKDSEREEFDEAESLFKEMAEQYRNGPVDTEKVDVLMELLNEESEKIEQTYMAEKPEQSGENIETENLPGQYMPDAEIQEDAQQSMYEADLEETIADAERQEDAEPRYELTEPLEDEAAKELVDSVVALRRKFADQRTDVEVEESG